MSKPLDVHVHCVRYGDTDVWAAKGRPERVECQLTGLGATPDQAVDDLYEQLKKWNALAGISTDEESA